MGAILTINRTPTDFVAKTRHLSLEQRGAYQEILDQIVILGQDAEPPSLPNDDEMLANIVGLSLRKWRQIKERLCFGETAVLMIENDRISQTRIVEEIEAARLRMQSSQKAGIASGEARRKLRERMLNGRSNGRSTDAPTGEATEREPVMSHESRKDKESKDSRPKRKAASDLPRFADDSTEMKAARYLYEKMQANNAGAKEPNWQEWARDVDRMLRIDHRDKDELRRVIDWCQSDSFWLKNILSMAKLRKQYERLALAMRTPQKQQAQRKGPAPHPLAPHLPPFTN